MPCSCFTKYVYEVRSIRSIWRSHKHNMYSVRSTTVYHSAETILFILRIVNSASSGFRLPLLPPQEIQLPACDMHHCRRHHRFYLPDPNLRRPRRHLHETSRRSARFYLTPSITPGDTIPFELVADCPSLPPSSSSPSPSWSSS